MDQQRKAQFNGPIGLAVMTSGNIYVADTYNDRDSHDHSRWPGQHCRGRGHSRLCGRRTEGGALRHALRHRRSRMTTLIVADTGNDRLRKISAGRQRHYVSVTGQDLSSPIGLAVTHDNFLYVTELDRSRVVQIAPDGAARVIAGDGPGFADGSTLAASISQPESRLDRRVTNQRSCILPIAATIWFESWTRQHAECSNAGRSLPKLTNETLEQQSLLWPFDPQKSPHEVVATIGEVRGSFDSDDSRHHLHSGLDVFGGLRRRRACGAFGEGHEPNSKLGFRLAQRRLARRRHLLHSHACRPRQGCERCLTIRVLCR